MDFQQLLFRGSFNNGLAIVYHHRAYASYASHLGYIPYRLLTISFDLGFFVLLHLHPCTDFNNTLRFIEACDSRLTTAALKKLSFQLSCVILLKLAGQKEAELH